MQLMERDSLVSHSLWVELTGQGKGCLVLGTDQEMGMVPVGGVQGCFFFYAPPANRRHSEGVLVLSITHRCVYLTQYLLIKRVGRFSRLHIRMCGSLRAPRLEPSLDATVEVVSEPGRVR